MTSILAFDRGRVRQPIASEVLRVNRSNHLARGLVFAAIPGFNEAVTRTPGFPVGSSRITTYKNLRAMYSPSNGGDGWYWGIGPKAPLFDRFSAGNQFTIASLAKIDTFGAWGMLTGVAYQASGWSSPYNSLAFKANSGTDYGRIEVTDSGGTNWGFAGFSGYLSSGETFMVTRDGNDCVWYANGAVYGSNSGAGTAIAAFPNQREVTVFTRCVDSPGEGHAGYCWGAFYWDRVLSAGEAQRFYLNPWQVFA